MDSKFNIQVKQFVLASDEIYIKASPEKVMNILKDISKWDTWRKDIEYTKLLSSGTTIQEGDTFVWKAGGLKYKSTIHTVSDTLFGWTGKTIGAFAVHNWKVVAMGQGSKVKVSESLEGVMIRLMRKKMSSDLPQLLKKDLNELKIISEIE